MFFAKLWGVILICYINQGNLIIKLGCQCQIPMQRVAETDHWPGSSNNTILYFYFRQINFSSGAHLSFCHPLFREMSSFLPLPALSLIPSSKCHQTIRSMFPKTVVKTVTKPMTCHFPHQYHSQSVTLPSFQLLSAHRVLQLTYKDSREMFYAPTTQF